MAIFQGVHHGGIGVSDMDRSLRFYGKCLGFTDVLFDYTGLLPGMERVTGWRETVARVVFIRHPRPGPFGMGNLKLVELQAPQSRGPIPEGLRWGELGLSVVSINCHGANALIQELRQKRCPEILPLHVGPVAPFGLEAGYWYIEDPDGAKVELIECNGMCPMLRESRTEGLNHVAFGVTPLCQDDVRRS